MVLRKQNLETFCSFFSTESSSHLSNEQKCINYLLNLESYNESIRNLPSGNLSSNLYSILAKLFSDDHEIESLKDLNMSEVELFIFRKLIADLDQNVKAYVPNLAVIHEHLKNKLECTHSLHMKNGKNPFSIKAHMLDVMALTRRCPP
ncbi:hypothetical protein MDAP_001447 [Mitosporidium daphniae]|uniref:Uncharacterized protein n=1 Tax=Mitosporidium daphniae TaxID=1485682 RepID=A0A098VN60_9MICR|nr:uncharacterized protein DI09_67p50 [Mitosporidium daphniae]KGG50517.1 hypothetical protein DI09_67p50 [Mitosporidium daphniae]|eukprot:XP_013236968.1 uncharacterized protein DI09_67p50 [Mitosporidium daphniae]